MPVARWISHEFKKPAGIPGIQEEKALGHLDRRLVADAAFGWSGLPRQFLQFRFERRIALSPCEKRNDE